MKMILHYRRLCVAGHSLLSLPSPAPLSPLSPALILASGSGDEDCHPGFRAQRHTHEYISYPQSSLLPINQQLCQDRLHSGTQGVGAGRFGAFGTFWERSDKTPPLTPPPSHTHTHTHTHTYTYN